jgi:hypothetical protein
LRRLYSHRSSPIILLLIVIFCGSVYALQGSTAENGSNAKAVHDLGITGKGVKVGLMTFGNVLATHRAFLDANGVTSVFNHNYTTDNAGFIYIYHDTPFAGIIKSRGTPSHPNDIGVAPDANIHCGRIVDNTSGIQLSYIQTALNDLVANLGCKVIVTGIQFGAADVNANGQSQWTLAYDYYAQQYDVIFANAAGNSYPNITVFGDGYNGITTGSLEDSAIDNYNQVGDTTINGPTVDGRKKPEVMTPSTGQVVPGYSGGDPNYWYITPGDGATSWAVPHTAGVAALLFQYANQSTDPDDGHGEVIKAVIVNSTFPNILDKNGNYTDPANQTWNNQRGYGRIDALRAYQTLSSAKVSKSTTITSSVGWAYDTMSSSATHTYIIRSNKNKRLVLTVTWNRKINFNKNNPSPYSVDLPLFNIDLTVKNPEGGIIYSETDDVNNLEKVDLLLPADGNYTVTLHNTTTKSRAYGLAFELLPPIPGDFDTNYVVDERDLNQIAVEWLTAGPDADIVHDSNNIVNWLDFAAFADNWLKFDKRYFTP